VSNTHLASVSFERAVGVRFAFVHVNGGAPMVAALLGGNL
jgi:tripartite-type tricarboxylate transporter receptor subunit TctC